MTAPESSRSGSAHPLLRRAARILPNPHYYGWAIVGLGTLASALSAPGQSFALSLYIEHLIRDLGIGRVEISSIYAGATLAAAAFLPFFGAWADRTSARRFLALVLLAMAGAMVVLSQATNVLLVIVALFGLRMLGQGAIGLGTLTATVRWFKRYRGRALAIVTLGYALGELVFPGIIVTLTRWLGWRGSLLVLAGGYALLAVPLMFRFLRERRPDDLPLDGAAFTAAGDAVKAGAGLHVTDDPDFSFAAAVRTPTFWAMLLAVSVSPMVLTAVIFHQVALFDARGWAVGLIPSSFAAYALASVATTYMAGMVLERRPVRFGVTASLLVTVAGLGWYIVGGGSTWSALLYGALLGASSGIGNASNSLLWPEYYGIRALGALKGVVNAVRNGATAAGPVIAALVFTVGVTQSLLVLAGIAVAGAAAAAFLKPPARAAASGPGERLRDAA